MRNVKPSGDFLVKVVTGGHEATAKVSDVMKAAGMAQLATDAAGDVVGGFGACVNVFANRPDLADENTKLIQLALDVGGGVNVVASGEV